MYTMVRQVRKHEGLLVELPALAIALGIAEVFYKFHSFSLECLAFLGTWLALSCIGWFVLGMCPRAQEVTTSPT